MSVFKSLTPSLFAPLMFVSSESLSLSVYRCLGAMIVEHRAPPNTSASFHFTMVLEFTTVDPALNHAQMMFGCRPHRC